MRERLFIGTAGAAGAVVRLLVGQLISNGSGFPLATFAVNMAGTLMLCFLAEQARLGGRLSPIMMTAVTVGFLGAFTTFSAVSLETVTMLNEGFFLIAGVYISASLLGGLMMAALGFTLARKVAAK
ncbi:MULTISPECIES: CrcB family protein [unclassified Sporosarcina]|uniref:fluoride efflux transporter FluC n=1 Tax=unclassified Sporosarcina TaxID=2647733 RepID=UPI0020400630|nr:MULTISPECIES: CrcB family protein [unclassified Sporosarcina]GKV66907.1 chromosome condensation protein CcrB [Sporosarcina sp. NCCP-2331]GLB57202.1 chromosome condensation protein CcrB [Sporosarcina sp. NCCP-2378]